MRLSVLAIALLVAAVGCRGGAPEPAAAPPPPADPSAPIRVSVRIVGIRVGGGPVMLGLYDRANFLGAPVHGERLGDGAETAVVEVPLPRGEWAAAVYQDENRNGELDRRGSGAPSEPFGLSNNPRLFGPPTFDRCRFEIAGSTHALEIDLR